ncbi:potassium transporter KefB [Mucilaginibacter phyllosphaerae]|uniref:Potassium transporter KefB n=1 Tax=Mucilaginibacter phyllosphaerae TaxID=1812349 RepID=A0A4Y8ABX0_9SPHI|nr:potassium transporter KefB [Mucilaginibacter phyllosphaerae]MBB3969178.1 hypothetical protein [Mucilaginibacter phyllosphaerae]TEW66015.1 potassium transporter KefB [Mucilaginibacter phyllosphaerae]GGH06829.1 hypothetical protein GCM10007352_11210 [Mucilaginibacter phyllosphaerae]
MTQTSNLLTQPVNNQAVIKHFLIGAGIALLVILFFLLGVQHPKPEWGSLWMIKPLIITPLAGGMGGLFFYFMGRVRSLGGWKTALGYIVSLSGYAIALFMGIVLGLNGTLWD